MATPLNINFQIEPNYQNAKLLTPKVVLGPCQMSKEENDYAFHSQRPDDQVLVVVATGQVPRRPHPDVVPLLSQVGLHLLHVHHFI